MNRSTGIRTKDPETHSGHSSPSISNNKNHDDKGEENNVQKSPNDSSAKSENGTLRNKNALSKPGNVNIGVCEEKDDKHSAKTKNHNPQNMEK